MVNIFFNQYKTEVNILNSNLVNQQTKIFIFLVLILFIPVVVAKDFGVVGQTFAIKEQNLIVVIKDKLETLSKNGSLEIHNKALLEKAKYRLSHPIPVAGVIKTEKSRIFTVNPTFTVNSDILDHAGQVIHKKGFSINPLESIKLSGKWIFFDGDDIEQCDFIKSKYQVGDKLILIKGSPLKLSELFGIQVYFDQNGSIIQKLGIQQVPAIVSQQDNLLLVEEILLESEK